MHDTTDNIWRRLPNWQLAVFFLFFLIFDQRNTIISRRHRIYDDIIWPRRWDFFFFCFLFFSTQFHRNNKTTTKEGKLFLVRTDVLKSFEIDELIFSKWKLYIKCWTGGWNDLMTFEIIYSQTTKTCGCEHLHHFYQQQRVLLRAIINWCGFSNTCAVVYYPIAVWSCSSLMLLHFKWIITNT